MNAAIPIAAVLTVSVSSSIDIDSTLKHHCALPICLCLLCCVATAGNYEAECTLLTLLVCEGRSGDSARQTDCRMSFLSFSTAQHPSVFIAYCGYYKS